VIFRPSGTIVRPDGRFVFSFASLTDSRYFAASLSQSVLMEKIKRCLLTELFKRGDHEAATPR
jgi:hypothetical protein